MSFSHIGYNDKVSVRNFEIFKYKSFKPKTPIHLSEKQIKRQIQVAREKYVVLAFSKYTNIAYFPLVI